MEVIKTALDGVVVIEPRLFEDARGYFLVQGYGAPWIHHPLDRSLAADGG